MRQTRSRTHRYDILFLCVILILAYLFYLEYSAQVEKPADINIEEQNTSPISSFSEPQSSQPDRGTDEESSKPVVIEASPKVPSEYNIKVPFTSQAPLFVWDALHEDACEEASLIMLWHWRNGQSFSSRESADQEIKEIISYESDTGFGPSITLGQLKKIGEVKLGFNGLVVSNISSPDDIKEIISTGSPVIVGAAGKILPNPNFRNGGPNYHMLLIKGYDENGFVTNDPGTRKGENYYYKNNELFDAIHDWDSANISIGAKNIMYYKK